MTRSMFRSPAGLLMACALALLVGLLPGCAANPLKEAKGADEAAYAVLGSYQVFQKQALKVVQDATLPTGIRRAAADADAAAFPVLKALDQSLTTFLDIKAQVEAGTSKEAKLLTAAANLKDWTTKAQAAVKSLRDAVKKKPTARATPFHFAQERPAYVA